MDFGSKNSIEIKEIMNNLYTLSEQNQNLNNSIVTLKSNEQQLENKLKESNSPSLLFLVICILAFQMIPYAFFNDDSIAMFIKENVLFVLIVTFVILFLSFSIIKLPKIIKKSKTKKQLVDLKEKIQKFENKKNSLNSEMKSVCNKYSIPIEVVYPKGLLYIKELVEVKHFDYNTAISLCIKNKEKINRPSLSEISKAIKKSQLETSLNQSFLERLILLPFKTAGAFIGVDKETIAREQRRKFNNTPAPIDISPANCEINDEIVEKNRKYTFIDGNGNLNESGNMFYDGKGNPCEWGQPFYDGKGNYIEWGDPFYDSKGNYCVYGQPFYDSKGNLINPK